jgi:hypothetical protein
MSDYRAVFVLPDLRGTVVFLASPGVRPHIGHERPFDCPDEALSYAGELSSKFGCTVIGAVVGERSGGDAV